MNRNQHVSLVVVSLTATLDQLAPVLGESKLMHHDLGTYRTNGLIRQQTIWFGEWCAVEGEIEDLLTQVLLWLKARKSALMEIDSQIFLKIICIPNDGGLAIDPIIAASVAELDVLLLVEVGEPPTGEA